MVYCAPEYKKIYTIRYIDISRYTHIVSHCVYRLWWNLEKTYMFYIFDWFISAHPHILVFVYTCLYPRILTCLNLQVHMLLLPSLHPHILASSHPHILRFMCTCLYPCILPSSCPQFHVCLLVSSHPHMLVSSGLCVLASILTSSGQFVLDTSE